MNSIFDNLEYYRDNPLLGNNNITECLLDLYFYILSDSKSNVYLESFKRRFSLLDDNEKEIIKKEILYTLNLEKPKVKIKER